MCIHFFGTLCIFIKDEPKFVIQYRQTDPIIYVQTSQCFEEVLNEIIILYIKRSSNTTQYLYMYINHIRRCRQIKNSQNSVYE